MLKSSTGQDAVLAHVTKGALIVGAGVLPLADDSWFLVNAQAAVGVTTLPVGPGYRFKTPDALNAITPAIGDDVYPLTRLQLCKISVNIDDSKGSVDVTDDCGSGNIPDGIIVQSGSASGYEKHNDPAGGLAAGQLTILKKFWDYITDDGAGAYVLTATNDDELLLDILVNKNYTTVGTVQTWRQLPIMIDTHKWTGDNKAGQSFEFTFKKGEGPQVIYERTTNASEVVI